MKSELKAALTFGAVAVMLLAADRYYRIGAYLQKEGFQSPPLGSPRCGTDLPSCQGELKRCANGFCISEKMPELFDRYPLPVLPAAPPS
jgi:hypothetical protein